MVKNSLKRYMTLYLWQICLGDLGLWYTRIFHSWKYLISFFLKLLNYSNVNLGLLMQFWRQLDSYLQNWSSHFRRCILTKYEIQNVHLSRHLGLGLGCRFRLPFIYFEIKTFAKGFNNSCIVKNLYFGGQCGISRPLRRYKKYEPFGIRWGQVISQEKTSAFSHHSHWHFSSSWSTEYFQGLVFVFMW